ncbi:MAG TPA: hypothetical protein VM468_02200 [Mycoplana sp.]|nr:hypothetical protein [Mycoplana sp.]
MSTGTGKSARPKWQTAGDKAAATDATAWGIIAMEKAARLKKTAALRAQRLEQSAREAAETAATAPAKARPRRRSGQSTVDNGKADT